MNKALKIVLWIVGILVLLVLLFTLVVGPILKKNTKKHSPEVTEIYSASDLEIEIFYSSPSKKDRVIFGELVPYNEVWRTGANEATTFSTNKDLLIDGETLPAGKYTLWTIPNEEQWEIIFNTKMYSWGVRWQDRKAMREAEFDTLVVRAVVTDDSPVQENFAIDVIEAPPNGVLLTFSWDQVAVPLYMEVK